MLNRSVSVQTIIDATLLAIWYAENVWYKGNTLAPEEHERHLLMAQAYAILLYQNVGLNGRHIDYHGIHIPQEWLPYFKERELLFQRPNPEPRHINPYEM